MPGPSDSSSDVGQTIFTAYGRQFAAIKRLLVRAWLLKETAKTSILSAVRLLQSLAEIVLGGLWNAYLLSGSKSPPDSTVFAYVATGGDADLARFAAQLAGTLSEPGRASARHVDLVMLIDNAASLPDYLTMARMFNKHVSLSAARDSDTWRKMLPTVAASSVTAELLNFIDKPQSHATIEIMPVFIGLLRPPPLYGNVAREFLKAIDCTRKYCAICIAEQWPVEVVQKIIDTCAAAYSEWRFIAIEAMQPIGGAPVGTMTGLIRPPSAGLDFGTRVALAAEADALFGPSGTLALASILSGRQVTLLDNGENVLNPSPELPNVRTVRNFELADLCSEIQLLLNRADATEFQSRRMHQEDNIAC